MFELPSEQIIVLLLVVSCQKKLNCSNDANDLTMKLSYYYSKFEQRWSLDHVALVSTYMIALKDNASIKETDRQHF